MTLHSYGLGSKRSLALAAFLRTFRCAKLRSLNINDCGVPESALTAVVNALGQGQGLTSLDVSGNPIKSEEAANGIAGIKDKVHQMYSGRQLGGCCRSVHIARQDLQQVPPFTYHRDYVRWNALHFPPCIMDMTKHWSAGLVENGTVVPQYCIVMVNVGNREIFSHAVAGHMSVYGMENLPHVLNIVLSLIFMRDFSSQLK